MKIRNLHISYLLNNMLLFRNEISKSASAGNYNADMNDIVRYKKYHAVMQADFDYFKGQTALDLPKSHPEDIELPDLNKEYNYDSPRVVFLLRLLDAGMHELKASQSAEKASGIEPPDAARYQAVLDGITGWIANMEATQPVDAPEHANMESL